MEEQGMVSMWACVVCFSGLVYVYVIQRMLSTVQHHNEPPLLRPVVPYLGHLVGLLRRKISYIADLSLTSDKSIFTLHLPAKTLYVIASPSLLSEIDKKSKTLSLWSIISEVQSALGGMTLQTKDRILGKSFHQGLSKAVLKVMNHRDSFNALTRVSAGQFISSVDNLAWNCPENTQIDLWTWIRHEMTIATTEAVYGPMNPYQNPEAEEGAWQLIGESFWLSNSASSSFLTRFLAPEGYRGREALVAAFKTYFASEGFVKASSLTKDMQRLMQDHLIPLEDQARFEASMTIGLIGNSTPTAFWTLYNVLHNKCLLEQVRMEVAGFVEIVKGKNGTNCIYKIDATGLRKSDLLISIINECLRYHSNGSSGRVVLEDTIVDNFLLKKGAQIIYSARAMHFDPQSWGLDVDQFNANRFRRSVGNTHRSSLSAFRGFGGGPSSCSGKHFSYSEITLVLALLVLRFDISPATGTWKSPQVDEVQSFVMTPIPTSQLKVRLQARPEWNDGTWEVMC